MPLATFPNPLVSLTWIRRGDGDRLSDLRLFPCSLELESRLQETSRRKTDEEQQLQRERERMEVRMRELADTKEAAEKEALVAR